MKVTKRFVSMLLPVCLVLGMLSNTAFAASGNLPFTDVNTTDWYYDAVRYAYDKGMMSGTSTTTFSPNDTTTRGMIVTILHRMEGTPSVAGVTFADVPTGQWYSDAVAWASANGIVDGYGNGMFGAGDTITREQMVTILYRYAMYKDYHLSAFVSLESYNDIHLLSNWANDAMQWGISEGIISGTTATTIAPQGPATRAQSATMLMRFCQRMEAKQEFYAKDIEDFLGAEIINFDTSNETNFAVLVEDAVTSESTAIVNRLISADEDTGIYTFSHIDQNISELTHGDILYITYGNGADDYLLLKVGTININGDTATITEGQAELSDYFQYIDVDMDLDLSKADFGLDNTISSQLLSIDPSAEQSRQLPDAGNAALLSVPAASFKDISGSTGADLKFGINGDTVSITADVKMTLKLKICYDKTIFDITEISLSVKQETKLEGKVSKNFAGKEDTYKKATKPVSLPITAGINTEIEAYFKFDVDVSADGSLSGTITTESGTKYSGGKAQDIRKSDSDVTLDILGNFKIKMGLGVSGKIKVLKVLQLSLSGEAGVELSGKPEVIDVSTQVDEKHLCTICVDGTLNAYFALSFKTKLGISEKYSLTLIESKLAETKLELAKFYISLLEKNAAAEFDWGKCPHKAHLVTVVAMDQSENRLTGATITIYKKDYPDPNSAVIGQTDENGVFKAYCENGSYYVTGPNLTGYQNASETVEIDGKAATILLKTNKENTALRSKVEVDLYTGFPQILYYNEKGQVVYCIKMGFGSDTGDVFFNEMFLIEFHYDQSGNLVSSECSNKRTCPMYMYGIYVPDGDRYYIGELTYKYSNDRIEAYDGNGVLRFAMDHDGHILESYDYDRITYETFYHWITYETDAYGRVTTITTDAMGTYRVAYDADGNITKYVRVGDVTDYSSNYTYDYMPNHLMQSYSGRFGVDYQYEFSYGNDGELAGLDVKSINDYFGYIAGDTYQFSSEITSAGLELTLKCLDHHGGWDTLTFIHNNS